MKLIRRAILAVALFSAGLIPAFAQAPSPVPALADAERRTSYSITGTTCACSVGFDLYGDGTDFQNWIEVFLNGVRVNYNDATYGWTVTSPSGSLGSLARPISNAVLTFNAVQTGTVQIVGARKPRRTSQFNENAGVPTRNFNQVLTDIISQNREIWDKTNDVTGRALLSQPGNMLGLLPLPSACVNAYLGFDATGLNPVCTGSITGGGSLTLIVGTSPIQSGVTGRVLYQNGTVLGELATTGSGNAVLATGPTITSPTLVTPSLGVATATSINGMNLFSGNSQQNIGVGTPLSSQSGSTFNVFVGPANSLTTGDQNVIVGSGGTGNSLTIDTGNTLIGYDVAPLLHNASIPQNYNTAIGNQALRQCTTCGSNVAMGRASMLAETIGDHNTAVGHATLFTGVANVQVTAIGDSAGGAALAGTAIPSGFPNAGTNVFPFNGDTNLECIGETCGKTSSATRKQSFAIGSYSRIPANDNSFWLGNGMVVGGTFAKFWDGRTSTTVNNNAGVTLTCAQLLAGIINRTGAPGAGFSDTTPTAQQIVQCASGGPGNGSEVPVSLEIVYINNGTGQTATILAGSGVTLAGIGTSITNNISARWKIIITNSTLSSEAVTFYRVS